MLNLVWLKSFLSLVQHQSFHAAAQHLGIAQPTLSQHIQKLEQQLEVVLIRRSKARCEPTRAALALAPIARTMLRLEHQARTVVHGSGLRIGASSNIGIYLLQPKIRALTDAPSAPSVDLKIDTNPAIANLLVDGELDVAVMEWWLPAPGFRSREWRTEPMVLIVPPGHPCADLPEIDRDTLASMTLLGGEPGTGTGRLLADFFGSEGPFPTVSMQLGSTEAVKQAVKAGLGISLVLAACVREEVAAGSLKAIPVSQPGLAKILQVVCPDVIHDQPAVTNFVSQLCH